MALRCLLFSTDETTTEPLRRVLMELGVEGEYCPTAIDAVERVTSQPLQIVILDWDDLPDAEFLLKTARERKAAERPLTLAIVSSDASVPAVLQAGANSILRKPIQLNQAKDTLTTARDLLRSKMESVTPAARAAAAAAAPAFSVTPRLPEQEAEEKRLRAGEFLSSAATPATHFDTESELHKASQEPTIEEMDPLKDLEPMAASMETQETPVEPQPAPPTEKRNLEWYLKARGAKMAPVPASQPEAPGKAELLGFDQTPSHGEISSAEAERAPAAHAESAEHKSKDQKSEAALFAYIDGEAPKEREPRKKAAPSRPWIKKVLFAAALAIICGVAYEVPQAVWSKNLHFLASHVKHWGHAWLNPQPVAPQQAPVSHESFGRAGDEYKLPTAETIPDASTDPSQIRVAPVVDPTAKQPNNGINPVALNSQNSVQPGTDQTPQTTADPNQALTQAPPDAATSAAADPSAAPAQTPVQTATPLPAANNPPQAQPLAPSTAQPVLQENPEQPPSSTQTSSKIPSSLKSQMASMTPDAGGNKAPEAALPSIEPVDLPEATARGLLLQQTEPAYPATAKGQQGTVVLQVLVGRDGAVQDAKFLQGSLAFARPAIEAVQQWRFKPYLMNGRAVSTKTVLTLSFKP